MMEDRRFGDLLRRARSEAGRTMGQVADFLDVSVPYLSDVGRGRRAPFKKARIESAAEFLGIDPGPLLVAASEDRGAFELETGANPSPRAREVGAALMRGWEDLTDDQLGRIADVVGGKESKG